MWCYSVIADVLVLLVTFFQFASFAFSQNWADAGYVQPVQKSSEKVLDLGLGTYVPDGLRVCVV